MLHISCERQTTNGLVQCLHVWKQSVQMLKIKWPKIQGPIPRPKNLATKGLFVAPKMRAYFIKVMWMKGIL